MKLFLILLFLVNACSVFQKESTGPTPASVKSKAAMESTYFDWSKSYGCTSPNPAQYYEPSQRLCKFWEVMDQGDYIFGEVFVNGMKEDGLKQEFVDFAMANLYMRQEKFDQAKALVGQHREKHFKALRVFFGFDSNFEALNETFQMELFAKIKANLKYGQIFEALKLAQILKTKTKDPWILRKIESFEKTKVLN